MDIELVKAGIDDANDLLNIQRKCFKPLYERYHDDPGSPYTESIERMLLKIAQINGAYYKIIYQGTTIGGIRVYEKEKGHFRLGIMYVLPEYQGKGIGQKSIAMAENLSPEAESWELDCPEDLEINRHCYEKAGYKLTGKIETVNDKLNLVYYFK